MPWLSAPSAMSPSEQPVPIESLLAHAHFVRRVARHLVADPDRQEEAVQQTWLAAIQGGPRKADRLEAWLRTVCRNFVLRRRREDRRRHDREKVAARAEGLPSTGDLIARENVLRSVSEAVLTLSEPCREAILFRYYEGLAPREIAKRLGVPATTIHSRLQRGLRELRSALDGQYDGERETWRASLVALCGLPAASGWKSLVPRTPLLRAGAAIVVVGMIATLGPWTVNAPPAEPLRPEGGQSLEIEASGSMTPPEPIATLPLRHDADRVAPAAIAGTVTGRLVDRRRRPVADARIRLFHHGEGPVPETRTGEDGRFALPIPGMTRRGVRGEGGLLATAERGAAMIPTPLRGSVDLGTFALRDTGHLKVVVRHGERPVAGARVAVRGLDHPFDELRTPYRRDVFLGCWTSDENGEVSLPALPHGELAIRADAAAGAAVAHHVLGPDAATRCPVDLAPVHDVALKVVDATSGQALVGVRLGVGRVRTDRPGREWELCDLRDPVAPTDERGHTRLRRLIPGETLRLFDRDAFADELPRWRYTAEITSEPQTGERRVALPRRRVLRWPLAGAAPKDGTRVTLDAITQPGRPEHRAAALIEDGHLVCDSLPVDCPGARARTPDGRVADCVVPDPDVAEATIRFAPSARLEVSVRDANDAPAAHLLVLARQHRGGLDHERLARLDAEGRIVFDGLVDGPVDVLLAAKHSFGVMHALLGSTVLRQGRGALQATVRPSRSLQIACRIDGTPGLPPAFSLITIGGLVGPIDEDVRTGMVRTRLWPAWQSRKAMIGAVCRDHAFVIRELSLEGDGPLEMTLDLHSHSPLVARVIPPADGWYDLLAERKDDTGWRPIGGNARRRIGPHSFDFNGLPHGRYRLYDPTSGTRGAAFTITHGQATRHEHLDLRGCTTVSGRVLAPLDGYDITRATVHLRDGAGHVQAVRPARDGSFTIRTTPTEPSWIGVRHPRLLADGASRAQPVVPGDRAVELALETGPELQWSLPADVDHDALRLHARRSGKEAWRERAPTVVGDTLTVGALPPGTWDLLIDAPPYAPRRLPAVSFETSRHLGKLDLEPGRSLDVDLVLDPDQPAPAVTLVATSLDAPKTRRSVTSKPGAQRVTLSGLRPGRYRLSLRPAELSMLRAVENRLVTLDPERPTSLRFDLRPRR